MSEHFTTEFFLGVIGFGLGAAAFVIAVRSTMRKLAEVVDEYGDPPTEELLMDCRSKIGPRLEVFGPGKPVPPSPEVIEEFWHRTSDR